MRTFGEAPPPPRLFERLKEGLSRSSGGLSDNLTGVFTRKKLDADTVVELEEALVRADLGAALATRISKNIARERYDWLISEAELRRVLADQIIGVLAPVEKPLIIDRSRKPFVILVAGVNGTGKTTTIGKLALRFARDGMEVVLAAG